MSNAVPIYYLQPSRKSLFKEIWHTVLMRRKHGVRGLGSRDWKLTSQELVGGKAWILGAETQHSFAYPEHPLLNTVLVYYFNLLQISFIGSISKNEPSCTYVNRSVANLRRTCACCSWPSLCQEWGFPHLYMHRLGLLWLGSLLPGSNRFYM